MKNTCRAGKFSELFFYFIIFFLPLVFFPAADDPFWGTEKFMLKFPVSILAVFVLIRVLKSGRVKLPSTPYDFVFAASIIISAAGVIKTYNIYAFADKFFINICYIFLFYYAVFLTDKRPRAGKKIITLMIFSASIMGVYGIFQALGVDFFPWKSGFSGRAASTLGNPNFLAGHMVLIIPLIYSLLVSSRGAGKTALLSAAALITTAVLIFTQTRGAYLAYAAEMVVLVLMLLRLRPNLLAGKKRLMVSAAAVLVITAGAYFALNSGARERMKSVIQFNDPSINIRLSLWENTLHMIKDNPLFGSGAGNFHIKYSYYQAKSLGPEMFENSNFYKSGHAHNDFLQFAAEYGLAGAGVFLLMIFVFYRGAARVNARKDENYGVFPGITAGITGMLVHGVFNFPFLILPTASWFFVLLALSAKEARFCFFSEQGKTRGAKAGAVLLIFVFIIAAFFAFASFISAGYMRKAKEARHFKKIPRSYLYSKKAVRLNPFSGEYYNFLSLAAKDAGKKEEAFKALKKGYSLNPGHWEINNEFFDALISRGINRRALEVAENAYKMSPYSAEAIRMAGYASFVNKDYNRAVNIYKKAIREKGGSYDLYYQLSAVYGALNKPDRAMHYAQKALEMSKDNPGAYYNMAVAYYKKGENKKALRTLNTMLKKFPGDENARNLKRIIKNED